MSRVVTLNRYSWLGGLGAADTSSGVSVTEVGERLADTEHALMELRGSIILNQSALKKVGRLISATDNFNKLRSQYAQQLSAFAGLVKGRLEALDELQTALTFGVVKGTKAPEFDAELKKKTGSADPGLMLLKTLPVLRADPGGRFAGLGGAWSALPNALIIVGVAISVAGSIKIIADSLDRDSVRLREQATRDRQFIDAVGACKGNEACLAALKLVDPKTPPPAGDMTMVIAAVAVGAALVFLWPAISGQARGGLDRFNARYA